LREAKSLTIQVTRDENVKTGRNCVLTEYVTYRWKKIEKMGSILVAVHWKQHLGEKITVLKRSRMGHRTVNSKNVRGEEIKNPH